jgi:hypothetical protein
MSDDIRVSTAARMRKYLWPLKPCTITRMCAEGCFKTAHKKGRGPTSPWFISGAEVVQWKMNRHAVLQDNI